MANFQVLEIKGTKVIFSAVRDSGHNFRGSITYDHLDVNLGSGFNTGSGTFTVPTSGTYRFTFSAQSGYVKFEHTVVYVKKNQRTIFKIGDYNNAADGDLNNLSYTWLMNLTKNDRVKLSSLHHLLANSDYPVTFTGELLHT